MPILCFPVCEEIPCVRGISGKALQQARLRLAKHNVNFGLALSTLAEHTSALVPLVGCAPSESSRAQWGAPADELAAMIDTGALGGRGGGGGSDVLITTPFASYWIPLQCVVYYSAILSFCSFISFIAIQVLLSSCCYFFTCMSPCNVPPSTPTFVYLTS